MVRTCKKTCKITREHSNSRSYFSHAAFSIQFKSKCSDWPVLQKLQTLNLGIELRWLIHNVKHMISLFQNDLGNALRIPPHYPKTSCKDIYL